MRTIWAILIVFSFIIINSSLAFVTAFDNKIAESEATLNPSGEFVLKWRVDYSIKKIRFTVTIAKEAPRFTWFSLGFSDRGSLNNSDVCTVWVDYQGVQHITDMHTDSHGNLVRDTLSQDCKNFSFDSKNRVVSFDRKFDTCDVDDFVIKDETVHVIWAHGSDKLFSARGLCLPCTSPQNNGFIRVRLLTVPGLPKQYGQKLSIAVDNLSVPGTDTTYWCKVVRLPSSITQVTHHITQFQSSITKGNEGLVHHMELFYCDTDPDVEIPLYEGNCFAPDRPESTKVCSKVKAAWAMGAPPFIYPAAAGLPLGGPNANSYVMLEVHYNNPEELEDWVDSSGLTFYVTSKRRKFDAAIMELGLEYTDKMAIPPGQKQFTLTGYCTPECTAVGLPREGIVVFGSQLHTHLTGTAVWTRHSRNGMEKRALNSDMHYSTHFQEIRILHRPVRVMPGDFLETTCAYNTENRDNVTVGGHAISDEMCVNYIHYYPATDLEVCKSAISNKALKNYFNFERDWDGMPILDSNSPRNNYLAIRPWTELRVAALHELYVTSTLSMQCNKSDGTRFQGAWEGLLIPTMLPISPEVPHCPIVYAPEDKNDLTRSN
ncbi:tyramine beta-hydroxylase isoform X2 [Hyposmocoma kahamanoa]|nr:tyramine beta-hydroxylase isoform X2 [Hyposmocoma kahamanoa]